MRRRSPARRLASRRARSALATRRAPAAARRPSPTCRRTHASLSRRPRRHPDTARRVVVRHRLAAARRTGEEFGFQVTFFRSRTGRSRRSTQPLRRAPARVRARRARRLATGAGTADARPARRARGLRHRPRRPPSGDAARGAATTGRCCARRTRRRATTRTPLHVTTCVDAIASRWTSICARTQPVVAARREGPAISQKGPIPRDASHYYSEPQLAVRGRIERAGRARAGRQRARAWLDHEWSERYLGPQAIGWDWVGFNLVDGAALMAFRMRAARLGKLWAGGSRRFAGRPRRALRPGRRRLRDAAVWTSPRRHATWPVAQSVTIAPTRTTRPADRRRSDDGRPGTRQPRLDRHDLLGRRGARARDDATGAPVGKRLSGDDRLLRADRVLIVAAGGAATA